MMNDIITTIFKTDLSTQIAIILMIALSLLFIKNKIILLFTGISKKTATDLDDIIITSIQKPLTYLISLISLILIIEALNAPYQIFNSFNTSKIIHIISILIIAWTLIRILDKYYEKK